MPPSPEPARPELRRVLLSTRVAGILGGSQESWTRRMFELASQLRTDGCGPVFDLSLGNPHLEPPQVWLDAVRDLLAAPPTGAHRYMTNAGFPAVRQFIAEREAARYGLPFEMNDVVMTVGAAGALNILLAAVADPGDEILVPTPYFSEYEHYCKNVGATLVPVRTTATFGLDLDALAAAIRPRTRMIWLNSPNNPTGAMYEAAELRGVGEILRAASTLRGPILAVEDSPYRDLVHDDTSVPSMLQHYAETVHVTSHSKDLGLAGERIGYAIVSPNAQGRALYPRAMALCNRILGFVNAPALMQRALPKVLNDPRGRVDVSVYARNCRKMADGLRALGFELPPPKAGFFLFPRLPERLRLRGGAGDPGGDIGLTERLRDVRTIVVPGTAFGAPGYLRLSLCVDDAIIEGALARFNEVCG